MSTVRIINRLASLGNRALKPLGVRIRRLPDPAGLEFHLRKLLAVLDIDVVFDVGGHWGEYGTLLRKLGFRGRIVSFEPVSQTFAQLRQAAAADPDWRLFQVGLSNVGGSTVMHVPAERTDLASLLPVSSYGTERYGGEIETANRENVKLDRLDSVFNEATAGLKDCRALLKLDTQGHDMPVLEGGRSVLRHFEAIQVELAVKPLYQGVPTLATSVTSIQELGFELTGIFPLGRDAVDGLRLVELDCVFRRSPELTRRAMGKVL